IMRMTFTAFALPRSTTVPLVRRDRRWDNLLTWCALITVITLLVGLYAFISQQANLGSVWQVFVPLYAVSMLFLLMFAPLWLIWWANRTLPRPGPYRPAVDIIIPAYNERDNIVRLLRSIDIAAQRYGGPVRVVVSNDGSVDDTAELAAAEIANFRYAHAEILTDRNGGQAAALNRGIAITDAEIVIRVDADCVLGQDALVYAVPWFEDPDVGSVGAMEEPRTDTRTWFHDMRRLETVFQFRFARLGQSMVDGIVVIPGTFTAFRRGPAATAGGFPVGMNGEDADLTMHIGRLGYRVVVDPRIRSYEDVPRTPGEFVEQRTRWARAGFHVYARHVPLRAGSAAPRVWCWTLRRGVSWFSIQ
ncbi:MAG: glycosyltransferase, partial [Streptosporangiaceae bacterium]